MREATALEGWSIAALQGITVGLDVELDEDLVREGRANDLVRLINTARKESDLEISDRIRLLLPDSDADLAEHVDTVAREVLAVEVVFGQVDEAPFWFERVDRVLNRNHAPPDYAQVRTDS